MFIATLFTIAEIWKQPKCPLMEEWIMMDKEDVVCIYIYIHIYYSAIKKEQNNAICSNMGGPADRHTEWNKSDRGRQIPCDIALKSDLNKSFLLSGPPFFLSVRWRDKIWWFLKSHPVLILFKSGDYRVCTGASEPKQEMEASCCLSVSNQPCPLTVHTPLSSAQGPRVWEPTACHPERHWLWYRKARPQRSCWLRVGGQMAQVPEKATLGEHHWGAHSKVLDFPKRGKPGKDWKTLLWRVEVTMSVHNVHTHASMHTQTHTHTCLHTCQQCICTKEGKSSPWDETDVGSNPCSTASSVWPLMLTSSRIS